MKTVLALDQGTTSSRAILFGPDGSPLAVAQQEFTQYFPQPGWVEHCPNEIWSTQAAVAREARRQAGITPGEIAALGITNQRETTVVWNRHSGEPITNAIVWQDRRTAPICDDLRHQGLESRFHEKTGLLLDPYFAGTKLKWILDHIPNARQQAEHGELLFGTIDSWLLWKLTDGRCHATDASNASRTLLCDLETGDWDSGLLELLGIPAGMLPEIRPSSGNYGEATTLFSEPIPIAGVAGDQQAALFGQGCHQPGMAKNTYGTGCFLLLNTGTRLKRSQHRLLTTVGWQIGQRREYALEGSIFIGGAVVQWLRDALGIIRSSSEIEALAAQAPDSEGVYFVPAFSGLGAPHWDAYARGTLVGLTRGTTAAHIARAALEGIAFQVLDVIQAMEADSGLAIPELRVDGGATANNFLMQFQADILGLPVARPKWAETTALGAAYLAGLGIGFWKDLEEVAAQWHLERRFEPQMDPSERERRYHGWQKALSRAKGWIES